MLLTYHTQQVKKLFVPENAKKVSVEQFAEVFHQAKLTGKMTVGSMLIQWFQVGQKSFLTVQSGGSHALVIEQSVQVTAESGV